ncbi:MAG: hypothetical protein QGI49_01865 [SAR202 cluster bacterium]|nr:hypothetical protein [SAR202 cluster bacterium]
MRREKCAAEGALAVPHERCHRIFSELASEQKAATSVVERFGRVDILLHLVDGWTGGTPVLDMPSKEVSGMFQ